MTTKETTRTMASASNNDKTKKGEITMNTEKLVLEALSTQNQILNAMLARIEKLEKSSLSLDKQPETKVEPKRASASTRKQASAPTRKEKPAKQPKKQAATSKTPELKTVKKFGTQVYLRAPRDKGNVEVAHVNEKTKRGNCVLIIHAKAQPQDMPLIREFIRAYETKLTYTAKLAAQGIKDAASLRKATDAQLMAAFGC